MPAGNARDLRGQLAGWRTQFRSPCGGYDLPMPEPGLVIVGSGPAGVSAAESFRRHHPDLPVTIVTADPDLPYARPPLSKDYLRGDTDDVELHPPQWYTDRAIQFRHVRGIDAIHPDGHTLYVAGETLPYRSLVLASGATPQPMPVPGAEHALQLRSLGDARQLRQRSASARSAVVIGAGFVGCEVAASLAMRGLRVTLVAPEPVPQAKRLGTDAGERLRRIVEQSGVRYSGGVEVRSLEAGAVHLDNGDTELADVIVAATGVRPNSELAEAAGISVRDSRILVGDDMSTSARDVYAAGDVALAFNGTARRHLAVEHWQDAADHGTVSGASAGGAAAHWTAVPGFWSTIGDTTVKYHAWGDGYDDVRIVNGDHGFTAWYAADGATAGVLTCDADDDYDLGERLIIAGDPPPV
jgi:3-phenylpropionate/trans-cinnamate dioxygenase ferredoxin reductase subunit